MKEKNDLIQIAAQHEHRDWQAIAEELGVIKNSILKTIYFSWPKASGKLIGREVIKMSALVSRKLKHLNRIHFCESLVP